MVLLPPQAALERYFVGKQMLEGRNTDSLLAAVDYFQQVIKLDPDFALAYSRLADAYMLLPEYTVAVDPREIKEISAELVTRLELGSEGLAQVYAFVGDGENALQALEIAFEERSGSRSVLSMKINPAYDFIRDEPRFVALLQKLGLSE